MSAIDTAAVLAAAAEARHSILAHVDDDASHQVRLEAHLLETGALGRIQLAYARQRQHVTGERLSQTLLRLGLVSESNVAAAIAHTRGLSYLTPAQIPVARAEALALFRREWCVANGVLPLAVLSDHIQVLAGDVEFDRLCSVIERKTGCRPRFIISDPLQVQRAIERAFGDPVEAARRAFDIEHRKLRDDLQKDRKSVV